MRSVAPYPGARARALRQKESGETERPRHVGVGAKCARDANCDEPYADLPAFAPIIKDKNVCPNGRQGIFLATSRI